MSLFHDRKGRGAMSPPVKLLAPVLLGLVAAALGAPGTARGVATEFWKVSGRDAFLAADLESLSVSSDGVVTLAPAFRAVDGFEAAYVWCLAPGQGNHFFAGTGNSGTVYEIAGDEVARKIDTIALQVESVVQAPDGTLYLGTAPDATIFSAGKDGSVHPFVDLPERHIWGLAVEESGDLLAATGDPARLYRVNRQGQASLVYEGGDGHFTSMARARDEILLGTESDGLVLAVNKAGKARVLFDAAEPEIKSILIGGDGLIYVAANPAPATGDAPPDKTGKGKEARPTVYRVTLDGVAEPIWSCPDPTLQALVLSPDGSTLYAAAGGNDPGGIYRIAASGARWALLGRPGPPQIMSLLLQGDVLWAGSGSPGRLFRGLAGGSPKGILLSEVHDAHQPADWGVLRWDRGEGGGEISFRTRSGNSSKPDPTWSDWSSPLADADESPIASPPGRFLQWEATFTRTGAPAPELKEVTAAYLERNLPPVVKSIEVSPPGAQLARGGDDGGPQPVVQNLQGNVRVEFSVSAQGSRGPATDEETAWMRRYRSVRWDASDPNDDPLLFKLEYCARGETDWRLIKAEIKDPVYVWDTGPVADGRYRLRVTASDAPQNSPGEAREAFTESGWITVDNTAPVIDNFQVARSGGKLHVTARLTDNLGPLKRAEISVNGGEWSVIHPVDRVMDEPVEEVSTDVDARGEGEQTVALRVFDQAGNMGVGRAVTGGTAR